MPTVLNHRISPWGHDLPTLRNLAVDRAWLLSVSAGKSLPQSLRGRHWGQVMMNTYFPPFASQGV